MIVETEEAEEQDPLRGFWRIEHCAPGPVRHLKGSPSQFRKDLVKSHERAVEYVRRLEEGRLLVEYWPDALLAMTTAEDWKEVRTNNWNSKR